MELITKLFNHLTLLTSKLHDMKDFYKNVLECPVIQESEDEFSVKIGRTMLTFHQTESSNPFYHYAINIPENKFNEARKWAKARVVLNEEDRDDEVFFEGWNAHALYFEDPSGNIVEFISRHNLDNGSKEEFSSKSFLCISEIGIVVEEVIPFVRRLNGMGFPNWKGDSEGLTPVGDENGLFIVAKRERRWFFTKKYAEFFPLKAEIQDYGKLDFCETGNLVEVTAHKKSNC